MPANLNFSLFLALTLTVSGWSSISFPACKYEQPYIHWKQHLTLLTGYVSLRTLLLPSLSLSPASLVRESSKISITSLHHYAVSYADTRAYRHNQPNLTNQPSVLSTGTLLLSQAAEQVVDCSYQMSPPPQNQSQLWWELLSLIQAVNILDGHVTHSNLLATFLWHTVVPLP